MCIREISWEEMQERSLNFPGVSMRYHADWEKLHNEIHQSGQVVELQDCLVLTAGEYQMREGD